MRKNVIPGHARNVQISSNRVCFIMICLLYRYPVSKLFCFKGLEWNFMQLRMFDYFFIRRILATFLVKIIFFIVIVHVSDSCPYGLSVILVSC